MRDESIMLRLRGLGIVVRSRIHLQRSAEQPLAGIRIANKDLFALRGIRSSSCSIPANETAECVTALTSLGAKLVEKTYECFQAHGAFNTVH